MSVNVVTSVTAMVSPILDDLGLELYDMEFSGGVLKVTIDTPAGQEAGVDIDQISRVNRLLGRELDHNDVVPGRYTLEVSSPGLERNLRTPHHFQREVGKDVSIRLVAEHEGQRRFAGALVAATDATATVRVTDTAQSVEIPLALIEKANIRSSRGKCAMSNLDMSEAVRMLAEHHGISVDSLLQVLVEALATAYKKRPNAADEVIVEVNPENLDMTFTAYDVDDDGNWINERDDTPNKHELGRIAAATFKQVMSQRIREVERDRKFEEYANREGDLVTGIMQQSEGRYALLDLGKVEALLPQAEQVPYERPEPNARVKAYIVEVRKTAKGPQIVVSRTHPGLIKRLFELEVPEIADGVVEIKSCAREPGHRTKIAVFSNDANVDPVGACVGARGGRVRMVVNELRGEKIDIVSYSEDLVDFVSKALSPAKVTEVRLSEDNTQADVIVPDFQLSLAIGKEGQNARLAARLTGVRIDIKSETQAANEANGIFEPRQSPRNTEYAEGEWRKNDETGELQFHNTDGSVVSEQEWAGGSSSDSESTEA